jgi:release factor glutamine methyltransferase
MSKVIRVADCITDFEQQLLTVYDDALLCRQYAWWTLETILNKSKAQLITAEVLVLTNEQQATIAHWLTELIVHKKPIQYLIGWVPFCDVDILVEPPILIPRPETEEWCSALIERLKNLKNQQITILDLCCGSGCIALALAHAMPQATVYAGDITPAAIALTKKNIAHNRVSNVVVVESNLFSAIPGPVKFDLVVTNPPYIAESEWPALDESVREWEDKKALCASDEGLAIIKKIIEEVPRWIVYNEEIDMRNIPQLMIEIGYQQGPVVCALMRHANYMNVNIEKDLEGKDRVVSGSLLQKS